MLASRGAVYLKNTSRFPSHASCGCSSVPVYKGFKISPEDEKSAQRWLDDNKGKETKKRRRDAVEAELKAGLMKEQKETFIDKYGREATRITYVDTEKGKQKKAEEARKQQENLDALKRNGADYKEVPMTPHQEKMNKSQANDFMSQIKNPLPR
jgi:predicted ATP-binding protein involved in virulence